MKIGVVGAGAIGSYLGGRLVHHGNDVIFVRRRRPTEDLRSTGITLHGLGSMHAVRIDPKDLRIESDPSSLADRDVVLVCVKSGQTQEVASDLARVLAPDATVVSMQNGVRNAEILREYLGDRHVLAGIVTFNVVAEGGGTFRHTTTGPLVIEASPAARDIARALERAGFDVELARDIVAKQWTKLLINLNNAISALCDVSTPTLIFERKYRRILAALIAEALHVLDRARIRVERVGPLPVRAYPLILRLPTPLLRAVARAQAKIDEKARSSMWQDLAKRRATEVDYLNGEIVRLAAEHGTKAPLNERIVALVHEAEARGRGSPRLSAHELWDALTRQYPS